ncbi:hypothetical protein BGP75_01030 [Motiliproteus sp. MSK22-1]|nr:hypothetical protein BGP75_01030 [Motiliproteus sp. MSK22-1]
MPSPAWAQTTPVDASSTAATAEEKPSKKRYLEPAPLPSVTVDGIQYRALRWGKERNLGQNGGYILAIQESSGEELWLQKIYDVQYNKEMEADKQDVFITKICSSWFSNRLKIENERGQRFELDLDSREVETIED